jgi:DNA-binding MarR family transcriptional regulator
MVQLESGSRKDKFKQCMHLFMKCNRLHHALVETKVSALGLHRSQHSMLLTINFNGNISQKELAKRMEISPAAVTVTLKKLEAQGFIERAQSEDDSRVNNITVTEKGRDIICQTGAIFDEVDEKTFAGFSEEELEEFLSYLRRVSSNLKTASGCDKHCC